MQEATHKFDDKIMTLIQSIHDKFKNCFPFIKQTRQLSEDQNDLLLDLNRHSGKYKSLVGIMAIDTYSSRIVEMMSDIQSLFQIAVIAVNCSQTLKNQIQLNRQGQRLKLPFQNVFKAIVNMAQIIKQIVPESPYNQILDTVLTNTAVNYSQSIYKQLKQQNQDLKIKLSNNDQHILNLQIKLTKLLNQHEGCQGNIDGILSNYQLRQQLNQKCQQIERMNEQFSIQIQKYNVVYESLKRELNQYRSYQNVDLIQQIQDLQTEIVRLNQQKERDQMIIEQLRQKSLYSGDNYSYYNETPYKNMHQRQYSRNYSPRYN